MGFVEDIVSDEVAPPWLQQGADGGPGVSGRYMQTCGMGLQAIAVRAQQAAVVSMPGIGDPSAIPYLCLDRLLVQGTSEPNASIVKRLSGAFDSWRIGGSPWDVLQQILGLFTGFAGGIPPGRTVSEMLDWDYYGAAPDLTKPPIHFRSIPANWNWDNHTEVTGQVPGATLWWRYWLIIDSYAPFAWCTAAPVLGGGRVLGSGLAIGFNISGALFATMRSILRTHQATHAWCRWIVIVLAAGGLVDQPNQPVNAPDGTWGPPARLQAGAPPVWIQARDANTRYVDGVADGS